jgi:twinkle protein
MSGLAEKLGENGIRPKGYGQGEQKLTCPKCSDGRRNKSDPCLSLKIDDRGATWRCHHCDWVDGFVIAEPRFESHRKREYRPIAAQPQTLPAEALRWFVEERFISEETLKLAKVGWSEKRKMVVFPYVMPGVGQIGFKLRGLDKSFGQDKDGPEKPYWLVDQLDPAKGSDLYIVEGEMDALALLEAGIRNVISVPNGGGAKRMPFIEICEQWTDPFERIVLALDADEKGQVMQEELARAYGKDRCWQVVWPKDVNDANAFLQLYGAADLEEWARKPQPYPVEGVFGIDDYREEVMSLFTGGRQRGNSTGLKAIDELYTVAPGQLTVVTGVPNHGKSELIDQLAVNLARTADWRFAVCSFENPAPEHIAKLIEKWVQMPFWPGPSIRMTISNVEAAMDQITDRFFFIRAETEDAPTIDWILERARALVRRHGVRGLIIDPYNEIEHKRPDNMSETEYVSSLLSKVKRFAQNHGCHVWFVAHPAKMRTEGGKTPVPTLYDISGSAHFVNKTDCGLVVHRGETDGTTEVWVRKIRFKWVGQQGKAVLRYNRATGVYSDFAPYAGAH